MTNALLLFKIKCNRLQDRILLKVGIVVTTIQDIAKKAGVSVATVSRVLNNTSTVTDKTRRKVESAIKELNYQPSMLGRNLRTSESRLMLVLLPSTSNPFYSEIIKGIQDAGIANHYNILLCETDSKPERENIYFNMLKNKLADGMISMDPTINIDKLNELAETHPVIFCSEYEQGGTIPYVSIDSECAAYEAVKHLISIGNKKIALINSDERFLYARQRQAGYERALKENNLALQEGWIYHTQDLEFQSGTKAMRLLLQLEDKPTAVFAVSDTLAIGALKVLSMDYHQAANPIAVFGFDNISFSTMTNPTLSTISQPMYQMGVQAVEMLIMRMQGEEVKSVILDHHLIIRESTFG